MPLFIDKPNTKTMEIIYGHVELFVYEINTYRFIRSKLVQYPTIFNKLLEYRDHVEETSAYKWECFDSEGNNTGRTYFLHDF